MNTPINRDALAAALMHVYDHGTSPNALREADAVIAHLSATPTPSEHDLDRMGICGRCGQGISARELIDGEDRCITPTPNKQEGDVEWEYRERVIAGFPRPKNVRVEKQRRRKAGPWEEVDSA